MLLLLRTRCYPSSLPRHPRCSSPTRSRPPLARPPPARRRQRQRRNPLLLLHVPLIRQGVHPGIHKELAIIGVILLGIWQALAAQRLEEGQWGKHGCE